jgi:phosphoglycolate phosphatase-like HAD superfamily hydrolase
VEQGFASRCWFHVSAVLIDLDGALGDTRSLWDDWLSATARVLGVEQTTLPADRGAASAELDAAGAGNWRVLLERFAAERAPVYLRPNAEVSASLRRLAATGRPIGVFTDAPVELAHIAMAQLGAARRIAALETGAGALERLVEAFGADAAVVWTREQLIAVSSP